MSMSGMLLRARVEEALEEQVVLERVDVGDAERVAHDGAGGRAAAGPHGDAVVLGELDVVPDDEEVGVEAHLADDAELEVEALAHLAPTARRRSGARGPARTARAGTSASV